MQPKSKLSTTTAELSFLDGGRSRPPLLFSKLDRVGQARRKKQREWILPSCKGCGRTEEEELETRKEGKRLRCERKGGVGRDGSRDAAAARRGRSEGLTCNKRVGCCLLDSKGKRRQQTKRNETRKTNQPFTADSQTHTTSAALPFPSPTTPSISVHGSRFFFSGSSFKKKKVNDI